jgi:hypothetical protein
MSAKTLDKQTAKFLAKVSENMPELSGDVMQGWIENPTALQRALRGALAPQEMYGSHIIPIDRTELFDPAEIIGRGWKIDEQDERALNITELDITEVRLKHMLKKGEDLIQGEERLRRLKDISIITGTIRLDAKILFAILKNQKLIPVGWNGKVVYFDGTILRSPEGRRYILYMYWRGNDPWGWDYCQYNIEIGANYPSATLASI